MCLWTYETNWKELKGKLNRHDILQLDTLQDLCREDGSVVEKLRYCSSMAVRLKLRDVVIDEQLALDIIDLITHEEEHRKQELKKAQRIGIDRALAKRRSGRGTYGRPHVELPQDFDEQVRKCVHNEQPLETYRRATGLKKATFYKYAKKALQ